MIRTRRMRWVGYSARMVQIRNAYILVGKPERKIPLGRLRRRWKNNIIMDLIMNGGSG
jgi:hypothetical protein